MQQPGQPERVLLRLLLRLRRRRRVVLERRLRRQAVPLPHAVPDGRGDARGGAVPLPPRAREPARDVPVLVRDPAEGDGEVAEDSGARVSGWTGDGSKAKEGEQEEEEREKREEGKEAEGEEGQEKGEGGGGEGGGGSGAIFGVWKVPMFLANLYNDRLYICRHQGMLSLQSWWVLVVPLPSYIDTTQGCVTKPTTVLHLVMVHLLKAALDRWVLTVALSPVQLGTPLHKP